MLEARAMKPDPDFEDFARDCIRLAGQERSRELRSRFGLLKAFDFLHDQKIMLRQRGGEAN
jgi:hypothetical protein